MLSEKQDERAEVREFPMTAVVHKILHELDDQSARRTLGLPPSISIEDLHEERNGDQKVRRDDFVQKTF